MISKEHDKKLFLVDAYALIFRSYFAFAKNPRINSKGLNTSAAFGFTNSLIDILKNEKPTHIAVVFDPPGGSKVRREEFAEYKAHRDETPEGITTMIQSNEYEVQRSLYPRMKVALDLLPEQERDMVWYLAPGADTERLQTYIDQFFSRLNEDGTLSRLREQYFGHTEGVSRMSSHTFNKNMKTTLPLYKNLIQQVAREYQMEWQFLAAIAYQESHWDPKATSPTGVRGLMMLTNRTAKEVGVSNRIDPQQSLRGGARYLKNIIRSLPKSIKEPDRTWLALAAYNIGIAHLEDARVLTERSGGNPNLWQDVMERLPLLQKSSHYRNTRYGYARGAQAAHYVQNVRYYQSILNWQDISDNKPLPPLKIDDYLPEVLRGSDLSAL